MTASALASAPAIVASAKAASRSALKLPSAIVNPTVSKVSKSGASKRSRRVGASGGQVAGRAAVGGQERERALFTSVEEVPRPWAKGERAKGSKIADLANLIDAEGRSDIMHTIRDAQRATGTEIVVVTVPSIGEQSPKRFATSLFNNWGIGRASTNNGVLVLVVKDVRRIEVEVGTGAKSRLSTSWTTSMLSDRVLPLFKEGRYSKGLERCVAACGARLSADASTTTDLKGWGQTALSGLYFLGVITGVIPGGNGGSDGGDYGGGSSDGGGGGGGDW